MQISSFHDLLLAARAQPEPQRLLFVFSGIELPDDATPAQRAGFEAGEGGAIVPLMCVDKALAELTSFSALVEESSPLGQDWHMVLVAALAGRAGQAPSSTDAEAPLQRMVESIRRGELASFIPFDRDGVPLRLG